MNYTSLLHAVQNSAGMRLRLKLQPLGDECDTIFPCTVASDNGGKYLISPRRVPGSSESVPCVMIDSVQSQSNRMEEALLTDIAAGNVFLPHVVTDFSGVQGLLKPVGRDGKITCLDAPHRVFDAILRDSVDESGKHFPLSAIGEEVIKASTHNATGIFQVSPCSLLLGSWDSTGVTGGLGEKYARCLVSELIGINAVEGVRAGTRIDPLNAEKKQNLLEILKATKDLMWQELANKKEMKNPSGINHGHVPWGKVDQDGFKGVSFDYSRQALTVSMKAMEGDDKKPGREKAKPVHGGVTVDYIQQTTTLSLAALRQLHFPVAGKRTEDTSAAARAVLAAIALHAVALNSRSWHLRSRCDLVLAEGETLEWKILGGSAATTSPVDVENSRALLKTAIEAARKAGLPWRDEPLRLKPSKALELLVVGSQKAHRTSTGDSSDA